ncbi:MAG: SRPBCC domain-containing protein [Proteobacteria bacterium]|nr:SRPBCC domain-containing protein [Pseudomonadota bacterium]
MATATPASASVQDRTIVITRMFDAPRERVFEVWTDARHLARWFGPRDFTVPAAEADVRVGGKWRICIRSPEGAAYWSHGIYREIVVPERLVFTHVWEEGHGAFGHETLITIAFDDIGGKTRMTFRKAVLISLHERNEQHAGWSECFDRLDTYVGG